MFQPAKDTKKFQVHPEDAKENCDYQSKSIRRTGGRAPARSSGLIGTYSPGSQRTCQEYSQTKCNTALTSAKMPGPSNKLFDVLPRRKWQAIGEEIVRLLAAGFIREAAHPEWLANPVMVRKKNMSWRMCVDYTDLNKACPKDPFPLPHIDQIIDSTAGCERLCFLDAYSGYHQIRMKESDQEKTSFITPYGPFCYITMPFGLKNAGATYQ